MPHSLPCRATRRSLARAGVAAALRAATLVGPALVTVPALPRPAHAWDDVGHMTVAAIAWARLSPRARDAAVALLRAAPADAGLAQLRPNAGGPEERDRALFLRAATWPDIVRDRRDVARMRRYHRATWHYLDAYWRTDTSGAPVPVTTLRVGRPNLVERLEVLGASTADARRPAADRAVDLAWILHLVGDIHQPLHTGSRVTEAMPRGDRGGNGVRVGSTNLHAVWDDALDRSPGRRPGRRGGRVPGEDAKLARAEGWAERLTRSFPADRWRAAIADTLPASWAREGFALVQRWAYPPSVVDGAPLPSDYRDRIRPVAQAQATLAGYRLAALLERTLGR